MNVVNIPRWSNLLLHIPDISPNAENTIATNIIKNRTMNRFVITIFVKNTAINSTSNPVIIPLSDAAKINANTTDMFLIGLTNNSCIEFPNFIPKKDDDELENEFVITLIITSPGNMNCMYENPPMSSILFPRDTPNTKM